MAAGKAVFCGNFEYDARQSEIERLFDRYGRVNRVDMKTGFAFVYMEDDRDAEDAIRALDNLEFGRQRRRLKVEWAKGSGPSKQREQARRGAEPSTTLFVVNFDPLDTRTRDIERHYEPFGRLVRVQIRKNFAFVQYENLDDAIKAYKETDGTYLNGRCITVEYAVHSAEERGNDNYDRDRGRRGSPDYGRYPSRSPPRYRDRSPGYGSRRSPDYDRRRSPDNDRRRSPQNDRRRSPDDDRRRSPDDDRRRSPDRKQSPDDRRSPDDRDRR